MAQQDRYDIQNASKLHHQNLDIHGACVGQSFYMAVVYWFLFCGHTEITAVGPDWLYRDFSFSYYQRTKSGEYRASTIYYSVRADMR
jgi:hypothetical protein